MSNTIRVAHRRLVDLSKNDVIRFPGGEHPGWWMVTAIAATGTNFTTLTLAQPLSPKGDWIKRTTEPLCYFDLVEIQVFEDKGAGFGVGFSVPLVS